jgi:seryl-tRNA synthetase
MTVLDETQAPAAAADHSAEYVEFRDALFASGLLVATGIDGLYGRSGAYEAVVAGLNAMIGVAGADQGARVVHFAPVMPRPAFELTGYVQNFPDLIGAIFHFEGNDRAHRELMRLAEAGEDWTAALTSGQVMLTSSACHPLYPTLTGTLPRESVTIDLLGWCFRHEPSADPGRMQAFRQREYVYVGSPAGALAHRDRWVERGLEISQRLHLPVQAEVANDPFFGRTGRLLANEQRESAAKIEMVAPLGSTVKLTAIASSNLAGDHFGHTFSIAQPNGEIAHSACVGFGLDRMTLALARAHGTDPAGWPQAVRSELGL